MKKVSESKKIKKVMEAIGRLKEYVKEDERFGPYQAPFGQWLDSLIANTSKTIDELKSYTDEILQMAHNQKPNEQVDVVRKKTIKLQTYLKEYITKLAYLTKK